MTFSSGEHRSHTISPRTLSSKWAANEAGRESRRVSGGRAAYSDERRHREKCPKDKVSTCLNL